MRSLIILIFLALLSNACQKLNNSETWRVAVKTDGNGSVLSGEKSTLIQAIRSGADLKIGWGWQNGEKSLEHVAIPNWIGILNEKEVYVYLDPQVLSSIDWEHLRPSYEDSSLVEKEWRVAVCTDGTFDAVWTNMSTNKLERRIPQSHVVMWWVKSDSESLSDALYEN